MEQRSSSTDGPCPRSRLGRVLPALVLIALVAGQAWLVLQLFGPEHPWQRLLDDAPLVAGRHPLHLYHGFLGARALGERGTLCCYDPAFQAGYPKTPVFDGGSRPAELFLLLAGGNCRSAAYKLGLALCCVAVPLLIAVAARGAGLGPESACLAAALGMLVFWGRPCRALLDHGDLDIFLAGLAALLAAGMLLRYDRQPGPIAGAGLAVGAALGCFAQPTVFLSVLLALLLVYYLSVGTRHGFGWHVGLLAALASGVGVNLFWLIDWVDYWWVLVPVPTGERLLAHRTLHSFWEAPLWGAAADRAVALLLFGAALPGLVVLNQSRARATARLLGLAAAGLMSLALLGIAWEPAGRLGATKLLVPALWFATLPAAFAGQQAVTWLRQRLGSLGRTLAIGAVLLAAAGWWARADLATFAARWSGPEPLALGLSRDRQAVVAALTQHTTPDARILWEDRAGAHSCWTALLPMLTGRSYLGGLDVEAALEYGFANFTEQRLAGRAVVDWPDGDLEEFCRRYNVGWVVCWTPAAQQRFRAWSGAAPVTQLREDGQTGWLFALQRPRSFVLRGQARWVSADCRHIALSDVVPDEGKVVLSMHYQAGLRVSPGRVQVEKEPDAHDPIPFVRLRMSGPVTRVTLTWEGP